MVRRNKWPKMINQITREEEKIDENPLVTFVVLAYNQERYICEALKGAFAQTYSPLEIVLSDDCSTDNTYEIMVREAAAYKGSHRVVLNRNSENLNIGHHINKIGRIASGELIVLAAGDDISAPVRTEKLVKHWLEIGRPPAVLCSDFEPMDANSRQVVLSKERVYRGVFSKTAMARGDVRVLGATTAVSREIWSKFPPLASSVRHEDRVLPFRALLLSGVVELVDEKLVRYRVEGGISRVKTLTARKFLYEDLPTLSTRTFPDASQRLQDLEVMAPDDRVLRKLCLITLAEHETRITLPAAEGFALEVAFFKALRRGAPLWPLLKLYLKCRMFPAFDIYFHIKNGDK